MAADADFSATALNASSSSIGILFTPFSRPHVTQVTWTHGKTKETKVDTFSEPSTFLTAALQMELDLMVEWKRAYSNIFIQPFFNMKDDYVRANLSDSNANSWFDGYIEELVETSQHMLVTGWHWTSVKTA